MPSAEDIADAVNRYIGLLAKGSAADIAELYARDATVEDPVGGEVHIGRQAIRGFYAAVENAERECELVSLRVAGNEAAFQFRLTVKGGDSGIVIEPIDVMAFGDDGKVTAMKAYWSADNVTQL
jgi:steroid Delta-isomerase